MRRICLVLLAAIASLPALITLVSVLQVEAAHPISVKTSVQTACYVRILHNSWDKPLKDDPEKNDPESVTAVLNKWTASNPQKEIVSFSAHYWPSDSGAFVFKGVWIVYRTQEELAIDRRHVSGNSHRPL